MASTPYRQDYYASLIRYKNYIRKAQDKNIELNFAGVDTGAGEASGKGTFTGKILDKYNKTAIYKNFSKKQSEEHGALRKKQTQESGNGGGGDSSGTSNLEKLKRKVETLRSQIADLHAKFKGGGNKSSDYEYDS